MMNCQLVQNEFQKWYCPICDPQQARVLDEAWPRNCHPEKSKIRRRKIQYPVSMRSYEGPGTELKKLLSKIGIRPTADCPCNKRANQMDQEGPDWCEQNMEKILGWLREEANRRGLPFVNAAGRLLVRRAIKNSRNREKHACKKGSDPEEGSPVGQRVPKRTKPGTRWAYGVTTVPSRKDILLPRTLASLEGAGFPKPRLFVDGLKDPKEYDGFGLEVTARDPQIKTFGNWMLAMWELYVRDPLADRYAVFQDDFVTYKNLREYLEKCVYPTKGYWNLYTFPSNQKLAPEDGKGWFEANQLGKGAVALVFSRDAVTTLLSQDHILRRPQNSGNRKYRAVDGAIVTAFRKEGWKEYTHNPSLVQHTGERTSMGNRKHQLAVSFRGEGYDALDLL